MEVADQWRREWAGTAEYGRVVEGGVTRQVARAMEVLHASGPGTKMRVMRAAYHASAAPGLPASSYMMHASRRVYSSGFDFLEQPTSLPTRPLEISSTPLESSPEPLTDTENYKVTEPDDIEISEPSKWIQAKSTTNSSSMPSEESSSTDNASIIDLDARSNHIDISRKYSYDSESSDIHSGRNSRVSPLLDAPVTLSTLKFKSLLNGSNEWNSRRKSYSFEDTSPLTESILHANDTLAMESSTDSGICKSTEIVNDYPDDNSYGCDPKYSNNKHDDSFKSWLSKNRQNNFYKGPKFKSYREHEVVAEDPSENNITLQSTGKVTITLPIKVETDDGYHYQKNYISEDNQRKVKKVEFCKTELHFTVDTGKVDIIATDEKPPPTNDFRKRRSAFVPMHEIDENPVILNGEKNHEIPNINQRIDTLKHALNEKFTENDENTAATRSILKNKIPKPKPYLLGENMAFGSEDILSSHDEVCKASPVLTAVSLINRQLQTENKSDIESKNRFLHNDTVIVKNCGFETINQGLSICNNEDMYPFREVKNHKIVRLHGEQNVASSMKINHTIINNSPTPGRAKTRELRDSDLTYFGIENKNKSKKITTSKSNAHTAISLGESPQDVFESVKLIQKVSSSVCNSESEDIPEYINVPLDMNYAPVPTPRIRSKFDDKPNEIDEIEVFKPTAEKGNISRNNRDVTHRQKVRREEGIGRTSRSRSEPRKSNDSIEKTHREDIIQHKRFSRNQTLKENEETRHGSPPQCTAKKNRASKVVSDDEIPIYANYSLTQSNVPNIIKDSSSRKIQQGTQIKRDSTTHRTRKLETPNSTLGRTSPKKIDSKILVKSGTDKGNHVNKNSSPKEKTVHKSDKTEIPILTNNKDLYKGKENKDSLVKKQSDRHNDNSKDKSERRSRSTQRLPTRYSQNSTQGNEANNRSLKSKKYSQDKTAACESEPNSNTKVYKRHHSKEKIGDTIIDSIKIIPKIENSKIKTDKNHSSREIKPRHNSKTRKSEYVINYDDKNGTVSSVSKIRTRSTSPRRKTTTKEIVKDKFRENLNNKKSDKAALLQPEDHQRNVEMNNGKRKRKSRAHNIQRSCQVL